MKTLFYQVASQWKADKRRYVKASSYATYVALLNKHLLPWFGTGGCPDEAAIQAYADERLRSGLGPKTVKDSLVVLKMVLQYGEKLGVWPRVLYRVHFPTTLPESRMPVLSQREQQKLLRHLQAHFSFRNLGLIICLHSGLRIGEVCGLQWKDLDVDEGVIHVIKTVQRLYLHDGDERLYALRVDTPKTASSVRDIPIARDVMRMVRPLRKVMANDFYVVSNAAAPLEPRYYRLYFRNLLQSLDIPPVRFHALRHSFATRCIESKCDYKTVSVILGHASLSTTMDLYVHPGLSDKKRCIERLSGALRGGR